MRQTRVTLERSDFEREEEIIRSIRAATGLFVAVGLGMGTLVGLVVASIATSYYPWWVAALVIGLAAATGYVIYWACQVELHAITLVRDSTVHVEHLPPGVQDGDIITFHRPGGGYE